MKTKMIKIISSIILMTGGALALTAGIVASNNNDNNVEVNNERTMFGDFVGSPLSTTEVEVRYDLSFGGSPISEISKIEYTFSPEGLGNDVHDTQSDNFPPDFLISHTYVVNNGNFINGETYKGSAKIILIDGTSQTIPFNGTPITIPAGEPMWDTSNTKAEGHINGVQLSLSIQGINVNPSIVFDPEEFYVEIKEISSGDIVKREKLSNKQWSDSTGTWKTEIRIENSLKTNTDYRAKFYFKGNGQDLPNTTTGTWEEDFSTIDRVNAPNWTVNQTGTGYEQININIKSDDVFHDWHGSLLGKTKPRIEYIKNIDTGMYLDESQYGGINTVLSSWNPSINEQNFNGTYTIKDLEPESRYEGNLKVEYNEELVKTKSLNVPFNFDTQLKKSTPTITVENINHTQIVANGWKTEFGIKVTPAMPGGGREVATWADVSKMEVTLSTNGENNIKKTINDSDIVSEETKIVFGNSDFPLKADTNYNVKVVATLDPIVSSGTIETFKSFKTPKNVGFIEPVMVPKSVPHTNNSMSFYLTWSSGGFANYEENISRLDYSIDDGNNWNKIEPLSNNAGYKEFTIKGLGPAETNDIWLKVEPNSNTEPGLEAGGDYIWDMGDDKTDYNPAPKINMNSVDIGETSVVFNVIIENFQYLTGIKIETTDLTNSINIIDINIPSNEISRIMTLTIDESNGIVDFNEYKFVITFEYDSLITYPPEIIFETEVGGSANEEVWTSGTIKTLAKQMYLVEEPSYKIIGNDPDIFGNLYRIEYNVKDTKGYLQAIYIIEDEQGNEIQRLVSTNTINEGLNHRYIGNIGIGYTVTIELWGESTSLEIGPYKHVDEIIHFP